MQISNCCQAFVYVDGNFDVDEGTMYHRCSKCQEPCDLIEIDYRDYKKKNRKPCKTISTKK